jgi:hypothetical protein
VSTTGSVVYDNTPPYVTINQGSQQSDPTGGIAAQSIIFDVVFSENVTGLTSSSLDISLSTVQFDSLKVFGEGTNYTIVAATSYSG